MSYRPAFLFITIVISLLSFLVPRLSWAFSSSIENAIDVIGNDNPGITDVYHEVAFTLPEDADAIGPTDYIQINLTNFSSVTAVTALSGNYTGTPTFSVSGTVAKVTGITLLPAQRITLSGITATNPGIYSQSNFTITISVTEDVGGSLVKNTGTAVAQEWTGTVTMSAELDIPQGRLQISGFTAPLTYVLFSEGENVIGTDVAAGIGTFSKLFQSMSVSTHYISVYGVDTEDRSTSLIPMTITTPAGNTTLVSNILLSPTVEINSSTVLQGSDIYATGSAYPNTTVTVFTDTPLRTYPTTAESDGDWTTTITNTESYTPGDYRLYVLAQTTSGLQSVFSPRLLFTITTSSGGSGTACGDIEEGDLNCDDIVNLTDFSILMYYWGTADATADMNSDGSVNITDFSIMMYYWGT